MRDPSGDMIVFYGPCCVQANYYRLASQGLPKTSSKYMQAVGHFSTKVMMNAAPTARLTTSAAMDNAGAEAPELTGVCCHGTSSPQCLL